MSTESLTNGRDLNRENHVALKDRSQLTSHTRLRELELRAVALVLAQSIPQLVGEPTNGDPLLRPVGSLELLQSCSLLFGQATNQVVAEALVGVSHHGQNRKLVPVHLVARHTQQQLRLFTTTVELNNTRPQGGLNVGTTQLQLRLVPRNVSLQTQRSITTIRINFQLDVNDLARHQQLSTIHDLENFTLVPDSRLTCNQNRDVSTHDRFGQDQSLRPDSQIRHQALLEVVAITSVLQVRQDHGDGLLEVQDLVKVLTNPRHTLTRVDHQVSDHGVDLNTTTNNPVNQGQAILLQLFVVDASLLLNIQRRTVEELVRLRRVIHRMDNVTNQSQALQASRTSGVESLDLAVGNRDHTPFHEGLRSHLEVQSGPSIGHRRTSDVATVQSFQLQHADLVSTHDLHGIVVDRVVVELLTEARHGLHVQDTFHGLDLLSSTDLSNQRVQDHLRAHHSPVDDLVRVDHLVVDGPHRTTGDGLTALQLLRVFAKPDHQLKLLVTIVPVGNQLAVFHTSLTAHGEQADEITRASDQLTILEDQLFNQLINSYLREAQLFQLLVDLVSDHQVLAGVGPIIDQVLDLLVLRNVTTNQLSTDGHDLHALFLGQADHLRNILERAVDTVDRVNRIQHAQPLLFLDRLAQGTIKLFSLTAFLSNVPDQAPAQLRQVSLRRQGNNTPGVLVVTTLNHEAHGSQVVDQAASRFLEFQFVLLLDNGSRLYLIHAGQLTFVSSTRTPQRDPLGPSGIRVDPHRGSLSGIKDTNLRTLPLAQSGQVTLGLEGLQPRLSFLLSQALDLLSPLGGQVPTLGALLFAPAQSTPILDFLFLVEAAVQGPLHQANPGLLADRDLLSHLEDQSQGFLALVGLQNLTQVLLENHHVLLETSPLSRGQLTLGQLLQPALLVVRKDLVIPDHCGRKLPLLQALGSLGLPVVAAPRCGVSRTRQVAGSLRAVTRDGLVPLRGLALRTGLEGDGVVGKSHLVASLRQ